MIKNSLTKLAQIANTQILKVLMVTLTLLALPQKVLAQVDIDPEAAIGEIEKPQATEYYAPSNVNELPLFISTMLTIAAVFMGLYVLVNVILAGLTALTSSGDPQSYTKIRTSITNSFIGLLLIVLAYTIAALAGTIFFGDSTLFIDPTFSPLNY